MDNLQIFSNAEFGEVRTIEENGKVLFCGKDITNALGYKDATNAIKQHCRWVVKRHLPHPQSPSKKIEFSFIPEGDVYRLITGSKLPGAQRFESWIFDEVLPTIRKTGGYVSNDDMFIATYLPHADEQTKTLFKSTLATMKQLNQRIDEMKPKELFADSVAASDGCILIGELAKLICQNGYEIGQQRLFKWMREHHYLINRRGTDYNSPTQKAVEAGLLVTKERTVGNPDGSVRITKTTMVTGKGQVYFVNKFLS